MVGIVQINKREKADNTSDYFVKIEFDNGENISGVFKTKNEAMDFVNKLRKEKANNTIVNDTIYYLDKF